MHRFRKKRRRLAALALLPFAACNAATTSIFTFHAASSASRPGAAAAAVGAGVEPIATGASASAVELRLGKHHVHAGRAIGLRGSVNPGGRHTVVIRVNGGRAKKLTTRPDGRFRVRWKPRRPGIYRVSAEVVRDGAAPVRSRVGRVNAYRAVAASYYGPGLYGGHLACGGTLRPSTKGVAHKSLPCGTKVTLRKGGRTVTVPVIDRGPYAGNREFDLTAATKRKLGFGSTGTVLSTK